ncbi:MAG: hypothetical protein AAGA66_02105, partial [Bacteroidota bacterium]
MKKYITNFIALIILLSSFSIQAQTQETSDRKEPGYFFSSFLDWVALSYATYAGELDAEANSVFSKLLSRYQQNEMLSALLQGMDQQHPASELDRLTEALFRQTGIRIYVVGEFEDVEQVGYLRHFNELLQEKLNSRSNPHILVTLKLSGNQRDGYTISLDVTGSDELNFNKYGLNKTDDRNPFWGVVQRNISSRNSFAGTIRKGLIAGIRTLTETVKGDFLPPLMISYRGEWYKTSEEIEIAGATEGVAKLYAIDRDGAAPSRAVTWDVTPANSQVVTTDNLLEFPLNAAGQFTLTATSGRNDVSVNLKMVNVATNFNDVLKQLLLEVIAPILEEELQSQTDLQAREGPTREATENSLADLEQYNYPISEGTNTLTSLQETPRTLTPAEEDVFNADQERTTAFERIKSQKQLQVDLQKAAQLIEYIQQVVDNDETRNQVVGDMLKPENLGSVLGQFTVAMLNGNAKEDVKTLITNYLNDNLSRLAGEDVTLSSLQPFRIVANSNLPDTYDPANNYYINPKLPYTDDQFAELEQEIAAYQAANPGAFVVVNYSQDVDEASFLSRVLKGRPVGLEEGNPYKIIYVVNYPGSILGAKYEVTGVGVLLSTEWYDFVCEECTFLSPAALPFTLQNTTALQVLKRNEDEGTVGSATVLVEAIYGFKVREQNEEVTYTPYITGNKFHGYAVNNEAGQAFKKFPEEQHLNDPFNLNFWSISNETVLSKAVSKNQFFLFNEYEEKWYLKDKDWASYTASGPLKTGKDICIQCERNDTEVRPAAVIAAMTFSEIACMISRKAGGT